MNPPLGAADVQRLRGVFLEVRPRDPDLGDAVWPRQPNKTVDAKRLVVLGDLVALRVVRVEVVLAVEDGVLCDLAAEREPEPDRPLDRLPVRHGQRSRMREADRAGARVRVVERPDRATAEHLRPRLQLDMDLETDDRFPLAQRRLLRSAFEVANADGHAGKAHMS